MPIINVEIEIMKSARMNLIQKGFTLIELLVVIGILGILATALIATIDPFEQLRKAQDSNVKNAAVEYLNANLRYYTTHNNMPWGDPLTGGYDGCGTGTGTISEVLLSDPVGEECLTALVQDGELKPGFIESTNITREIYVSGTDNAVTACYEPQSKSGQNDPTTRYTADGVETTGCKSQGGANDCYYCTSL